MKKIFILFTLSGILLSCSKPASQAETEVIETASPDLKNSIWVNARYLELLDQSKSPLKAKIYADTVLISFNSSADTANIVWNFHEGSPFSVKNEGKLELFNTYEPKQTPEYSGNVDADILKLGITNFKKVDTMGFIEKKFWIGKYSSANKTVELRADNQLLGVDGFDTYRVWVDYVTTQTDIDLIDFGKKNSDVSTTYGYKFEGNEVVFYEFIWQEDGLVGKAGKEVFRWKRL